MCQHIQGFNTKVPDEEVQVKLKILANISTEIIKHHSQNKQTKSHDCLN